MRVGQQFDQPREGLAQSHLDSFNDFVEYGLAQIVASFQPMKFSLGDMNTVSVELVQLEVGKQVMQQKIATPRRCREGATTYTFPLMANIRWSLNSGVKSETFTFHLCDVPNMVRSQTCALKASTTDELIRQGEETTEFGGYFIVSGIERVVRLLIQQRRHYVMGLIRSSFCSRGPKFTKYATVMRCVDACERSSTVRLHYLHDGSVCFGISIGRQEVFLPLALIFQALTDISDTELYDRVLCGVTNGGSVEVSYARECLNKTFESRQLDGVSTRKGALEYIGGLFSAQFHGEDKSLYEIGEFILQRHVFIHLQTSGAKQDVLIFMLNKLLSLVSGTCKADNPDSLVNQELLLPGYLIQNILQEKIAEALNRVRDELKHVDIVGDGTSISKKVEASIITAMKRLDIGRQMEYFLATGNLVSKSGLGLSQTSGFTIVAEKLNYLRYISHFRSVHRGAYFAELRTTTVRKLLPESWGFLCPVHTPDGSPCGLLMHLSSSCRITTGSCPPQLSRRAIYEIVCDIIAQCCQLVRLENFRSESASATPIMLDGILLGYIQRSAVTTVIETLRLRKVTEPSGLISTLEIASMIPSDMSTSYSCIAMFSTGSRLMRPVFNTQLNDVEMIGTMEQDSIYIQDSDDKSMSNGSHRELNPGNVLSAVASLTPWSDFNQSPRNMYQCQMAKQTMGFPLHSFHVRSDTKLYRLHTPQRPISLTSTYDSYDVDSYPLGTNAVVAVLSHTGYDMEDAMIVNKSAVDRGFAHATLYKTETLQLDSVDVLTRPHAGRTSTHNTVDSDGLPCVGQRVSKESVVCATTDAVSHRTKETKYKNIDESVIDKIKRMATTRTHGERVCITYRYNRNPVIGDKFSSRHGQKGVLSFLWPDEDLPYIENTGIRPDILINPHAFPSRMTIGMLVESMASKGGALVGKYIDSTPFNQGHPLNKYGRTLRELGYNHTGSETMVNGITGERFDVDIYIGLVYYQRLRHMVSDKFQVRSTGPSNPLTKQPIKGRKAGGGVRFGEMERDSLLAHGAAALLRDRLHLSSDTHISRLCCQCGSLISVISRSAIKEPSVHGSTIQQCRVCQTSSNVTTLTVPYVFKYLISELAAMNIRVDVCTSRE